MPTSAPILIDKLAEAMVIAANNRADDLKLGEMTRVDVLPARTLV